MARPLLVSFLFSILLPAVSLAQTATPQAFPPAGLKWVIEEITDGSIPYIIVPDSREKAKNGLPDGRVATGKGDIVKAWYSEPTTRYAHAVLGDNIEAGALKIVNARGESYTFRLPRTEVFEDITPRIADLDNDGRNEVITILSSATQGASIAIFHLNGNAFVKAAQTSFIGRSNRWLNIAGIGNMVGGAQPEIAAVMMPHLAGILRIYTYQKGKIRLLASAERFSNHAIGSRELRLSTMADIDGDGKLELVLPSMRRNELLVVGAPGGKFSVRSRIPLPARINRAIGTRQVNGRREFVVGLDDKKIYAVGLQ